MWELLKQLDQGIDQIGDYEAGSEWFVRRFDLWCAIAAPAPQFLREIDLSTMIEQADFTMYIVDEETHVFQISKGAIKFPVIKLLDSLKKQFGHLSTTQHNLWSTISPMVRREILLLNNSYREWRSAMRECVLRGENTRRLRLAAVSSLVIQIPIETIAVNDQKCGICRHNFKASFSDKQPETPVQLPCGPIFGSDCLTSWLWENWTCPICQRDYQSVLPQDISYFSDNSEDPENPENSGDPEYSEDREDSEDQDDFENHDDPEDLKKYDELD
jgi:hypothetical protein